MLMVLPVIDGPYSRFMQKWTNVHSGKCVVSRADEPRCEPGGNEGDGYDGWNPDRPVARPPAPRADAAAGDVGAAAPRDDADRVGACAGADRVRRGDRPRVLQRMPGRHADRRLRRSRRAPGAEPQLSRGRRLLLAADVLGDARLLLGRQDRGALP